MATTAAPRRLSSEDSLALWRSTRTPATARCVIASC